MQRWGISSDQFTTALGESQTDDQILAWLLERVTPDRMRAANSWVLGQKFALDRQDAEEGVSGAVAPKLPWQIIVGLAVAALMLLAAWLARVFHA